jgi:hypothetical protein
MIIVVRIKVTPSPINFIHLLRVDNLKISGYSYPWVTGIRIGVHLIGEISCTWHVRAHDKPYEATFHIDSIELDGF